ncbi:MAG: amidohydrolase family protein [Bryobacteraceae bacterium]
MIIDTNVYLSRWPFRRLPDDEPAKLVAALRGHSVSQAWAGSFDGILHKDVAGVNERLAADCRQWGDGLLVPFGTVNPALPDWKEDLRRCHERHHMPGIRLHPNYHGYGLDSPLLAGLLEDAAARGMLVQIAACMEDVRTQNPLVRVREVNLAPLADLLGTVSAARVQILNWRGTARDVAARLAGTGRAYFDLAMLEGVEGLARLRQTVPLPCVLFGSNSPLYYFDSARLKVREAGLPPAEEQAVLRGNAVRVLGRTAVAASSPRGK